MDKGIQKGPESHERDKCAGGADHKAAGSGRPGRKPQKQEPGINCATLILIVGILWPKFNAYLDSVDDFRRRDRVVYGLRLLVFLAILERIMGHTSNRQHDDVKYEEFLKETVSRLTESHPEFLPHPDTIRYLIERLKPDDIDGVRRKMVNRLLRGKILYGTRTGDWLSRTSRFYRVVLDGVHYHSSASPIPNSTHRNHSDGRTEYMLTALEASIVTPGGFRIPLMTEFIANPAGEYDKQDCELKAAKRLLKRLKDKFGRLKLILLFDSLYLCGDILGICRANGWGLSVSVDKNASAFLKEIEQEMAGRSARHSTSTDLKDGRTRKVSWRNGMKHKFGETQFTLNVIRMTKDNGGKEERHVYATTIFLHSNEETALRVLDEVCRARWQIEEQFKVQKHHGLALEKAFGTRGFAGQNYYIIVQIADIIRTFMMHSSLFRRLQQHFNREEVKEVIQRPMLDYYRTIANFVDNFRRAILGRPIPDIDMSRWRLSYDTG